MAYTDNFPQRPVFMADFANGGRIDPRMTFTRASTANVWDGSKHLSSENLIANSEALTGTGYIAVNVTPTTGQADPTGGTNAVQFEQDSGQTTSGYVLVENQPSSGQFTYSFHAKANGKNWIVIQEVFTDSSLNETWFSISGAGGAGTTNANHTNVTVTKFGDWYRCSWTMTSTRVGYLRIGVADSDGSTTVTDSGGVYLYGLQRNTGGSLLDYQSTSGQIHREYAPSLVSKSNNIGRFDHTTDGQSVAKGILIEGQSTNLVTHSSDFSDASFGKTRASISANTGVGPDGTLTADSLVVDGTAANNHGVYFTYTTGGATSQAISVYAKAGSKNVIAIRFSPQNGAFTDGYAYYDLSSAITGSVSASITATAEDCGNGWVRCTAVTTALTNAVGTVVIYVAAENGNVSLDGNNYDYVQLWGCQAEANASHASSLISTSGGAATRAAESLSVATADIGYTGGPFTIVSETDGGYGWYPQVWTLSDESSNNRVYVFRQNYSASDSTNWYLESRSDGASVVSAFFSSSASAGKLAVSYNTNDVSFCASGGAVTTDTAASLPSTASELQIGSHWNSTDHLNGHIKRIALYGEALSDANLVSLTS